MKLLVFYEHNITVYFCMNKQTQVLYASSGSVLNKSFIKQASKSLT